MDKMIRSTLLALLVAAPLAAAAQTSGNNGFSGGDTVGTCGVTRLDAFGKFIAGRPTVPEFRAAYGCVQLVLPGDVTSREMRGDNSRYIATLDAFGRIVGGQFQ